MDMTAHPHGTFCLPQLNARDPEAAKRYYEALFGWLAPSTVEGRGGAAKERTEDGAPYTFWQLDGRDVAALRPSATTDRWVPYVAVESADATAARAKELGASIVAAPHDIAGVARLAVIQDPAGGLVGLWEARGHQGAARLDDPGCMWWAELLTRDVAVAKTFYSSLFGWDAVDTLKYGIRYGVFRIGDQSIGGLLPIGTGWDVQSRWQVLFAVEDADAAIARAKELGGTVHFGPQDIPNAGRAAVIRDPQGAMFVVMQPLPVRGQVVGGRE